MGGLFFRKTEGVSLRGEWGIKIHVGVIKGGEAVVNFKYVIVFY